MVAYNPNPLVVLRTMWEEANKARDDAEVKLAQILCERLGVILGACRVTGPRLGSGDMGPHLTITPVCRRAQFMSNGFMRLVLSGPKSNNINRLSRREPISAYFDAHGMLTTKFTVEGT